ncbi:MAG: radical SAM protein [Nanoarchaeota archaeon]|nr:radical SAM protein [Nanoarchaeota archaeon]
MDLKENPKEDILMGILKGWNELAVTTACNINCIFCSRKFNPFKSHYSHRKFTDIKAELRLFNPNNTIHVNASVSRLTDGEPFTHPRIWDILKLIREYFPYRGLEKFSDRLYITTNGTYLTKDYLKRLEKLKGVRLIHSINSTDVKDWMKLSNASKKLAEIATNVPRMIGDFNLDYIPSIVALPKIVGFDGIEKTITDLDNCGVKTLRVFLPTYTKYASKKEQEIMQCDKDQLFDLINKLSKKVNMKILIYPQVFEDVTPKLEGYENIKIYPSDKIISINKVRIFSRAHAQRCLLRNRISIVHLKSGEKEKKVIVYSKNIKNVNYIDERINKDCPFVPKDIESATKSYKNILVLHSVTGKKAIRAAFKKSIEWSEKLQDKKFYFQTVYNDFYGGSVMCGGLLMCSDYKKYLQKFIDKKFKPDLVLMSRSSFDLLGRDLLKDSIYEVCEELGVEFKIV